jgi:hypothetical protein
MPTTKHPAPAVRPGPPSDGGRNAVRRNFTGLPAEWAELDHLARRLARPGYARNASAALHAAVKAVLDAEGEGILAIEEGAIRVRPKKSAP